MIRTVAYFVDSDVFGGVESVLLTLIAGLDRDRWRPVLIYPPEPGLEPLLRGATELGVTTWAVPRANSAPTGAPLASRFHSALPVRIAAIARILKREGTQVFHAHLNGPLGCQAGLLAAAAVRTPALVVTEHCFGTVVPRNRERLQQRLLRLAIDRYLPVSREVSRLLETRMGIPMRAQEVIPNGVELDKFVIRAAPIKKYVPSTRNRTVVFTAARLDPPKGLECLLKAAAMVPDADFVIAGEGPQQAALESRSKLLGIDDRVTFLGFSRQVPELLTACDIFVLPSLYEGLPLSILEAMAAGKPVIASDIGGVDEVVVPTETGLLVPPGDVAALAAALRTLVHSPDLRAQFGAAGKERVRRQFSADAMVQRVCGVYEDILARKALAVPSGNPWREGDRNRVLRRADWRFLLPDAAPIKSACFADAGMRTAVEQISEAVFEPSKRADSLENPIGKTCDLAVMVNPSMDTLVRAYSSLRPGGHCYSEWHAHHGLCVWAVQKRLTRTGFSDVHCYWPWPNPARKPAQFWLPLDAPRITAHFFKTRPPSKSRMRRALFVFQRSSWSLLARLGIMTPICVVARRPGEPAPGAGNGSSLQDTWSPQSPMLLWTGGPRSVSKPVALLFPPNGETPSVALKMARVPESIALLRREAETLSAIGSLRPDGIQGAPRLVFHRETLRTAVVGETPIAGVPLYSRICPATYHDLAMAGTEWLLQLAREEQAISCHRWWARGVENILTDFERSFGHVIEPASMQETRDSLATLGPLPVVCEHRDFGPWNIMYDENGSLGVLDWEGAELSGLPLMDLTYFLAYMGFVLDGAIDSGRYLESYRASLDSGTLTGNTLRKCLLYYTTRTGVSWSAVRPLRLLVWLIHSQSEVRRFGEDRGERPTALDLKGSLFLSLWMEELRAGRTLETGGR